jgi:hypothetical protein
MVGIEVSALAPVYDSPFSTAHVVRPENVLGHVPGTGVVVTICVVVVAGGGTAIVRPVRPTHSPASTAPMLVHRDRPSSAGRHTLMYSMQRSPHVFKIAPVLVSALPEKTQSMS